jgi:hypothetical protein
MQLKIKNIQKDQKSIKNLEQSVRSQEIKNVNIVDL